LNVFFLAYTFFYSYKIMEYVHNKYYIEGQRMQALCRYRYYILYYYNKQNKTLYLICTIFYFLNIHKKGQSSGHFCKNIVDISRKR